MSRIGPELTDQRYCVWGAIRPTPVATRVALDTGRHRDVSCERIVRRARQHGVVTDVAWRQHYLQVVVHIGHPRDAPGRLGRPRAGICQEL